MRPAEIKRCLELYRGDPRFKAGLDRGDRRALDEWGLDLDLDRLRPLLRPDEETSKSDNGDPVLEAYQETLDRLERWARRIDARAATANVSFRQWRARQIARLATQTSLEQWKAIQHRPFAIELTRGCSVGCAYCSFAAPPLSGVARYTRDNEALFTSVLSSLAEFFGEGADTGFLYSATEPFDNRDYERYLAAFHDALGTTPQTTTAAWHRDIPRARRFIESHRVEDGPIDRFSINSLDQLRLCMREFSADELEKVLLVQQHPDASPTFCSAGRGAEVNPDGPIKTNSCLTGFLINLVDRSAALVSPCCDPERWPLGYAVYRRTCFEDARELADFLRWCEATVMREEFDDDLVVRLRDDLRVEDGRREDLVVTTSMSRLPIEDACEAAIIRSLNGGARVESVVDRLMGRFGPALVYHRLKRFHDFGLFEHLP
jgi:radical SAM family RiPP maturation amino acid epimerase